MPSEVIIIDSGIDLKNEFLSKRVIGGINIEEDNNEIKFNDCLQDFVGHGTSVASIIMSVCNECSFYPIRIVDKKGNSSSRLLIKALEYCKKVDIRVICISMATIQQEYYKDIEKICDQLQRQGKIIVSSLHNLYKESAPAIFQSVVGVKGKNFKGKQNKFEYKINEKIQSSFDDTPQLALDLEGRYSFFKGTSKANALCVGYILNLLKNNLNMSFEKLNNVLEKKASDINIENDKCRASIDDKERIEMTIDLKNILEKTIKRNVNEKEFVSYPLMTKFNGLNYNNYYNFLLNIEKYYDINFDYKNIVAEDVCTINNLMNFIILNNRKLVAKK